MRQHQRPDSLANLTVFGGGRLDGRVLRDNQCASITLLATIRRPLVISNVCHKSKRHVTTETVKGTALIAPPPIPIDVVWAGT